MTKNLVRNRSQFWCEIDLNLVRNRPFYQTGFGAKLTSLLYWIWCEIYLFTLLNLVRNRPKFGAKSTFLPLWIWCEINLNLVPNRHTIWKLTEFLRGENGFWSRQRAQQILLCPWGDFAPKSYDFAVRVKVCCDILMNLVRNRNEFGAKS